MPKRFYTNKELPQTMKNLSERDKRINKEKGFHPNNKSKWTYDDPPKRLKLCIECHIYQLEENFNQNSNKWDGLSNYCKPCHSKRETWSPKRKIRMKNYRNRKDEILNIRKDLGCSKCGEQDKRILEFNHLDPSIKQYEIASLKWSRWVSEDKFIEEIEKCEVLCRNCHRTVTYESRGKNYTYSRRTRTDLAKFILDFKGTPCTDCKRTFDPYIMDFDHLPNSNKLFTISSAVGRGISRQKIKDEINKCELVCANCHMIRTLDRSNDKK